MSKTTLILEALFTGADEDEVKRRDTIAPKILWDEWFETFKKRDDVHLTPNGYYNVDNNVNMSHLALDTIPIKFNRVDGSFHVDYNNLKDLRNSPIIVGDVFTCTNNEHLTSLEGAPKKVGAHFWCMNEDNPIKFTKEDVQKVTTVGGNIFADDYKFKEPKRKTLTESALFTGADEDECKRRDEIAPKVIQQDWIEEFLKRKDVKKLPDGSYDVDGYVDLMELGLTNLPLKFNVVGEDFLCNDNYLTSLKGSPKTVGGDFWCRGNNLTSLEGAPKTVGGNFGCFFNRKKFTEEDVRAVSDVKGEIYV